MTAPKWFACGICGLTRLGLEPVHGDNPCPMKVEEHKALMDLLASQRASQEGQGFASSDMVAMMNSVTKRILGVDDDD